MSLSERRFLELLRQGIEASRPAERVLCIDINLDGKDREKVERIRQRVAARHPRKGSLYYRDEHRPSCTRGGEGAVLKGIAAKRINGNVEAIDGIFTGGVNVMARVNDQEAARLENDPSFHIRDGRRIEEVPVIFE